VRRRGEEFRTFLPAYTVQAPPALSHVLRHPGEPLLPTLGTEEVLGLRLGVAGDARVRARRKARANALTLFPD
jgi:hypothetical protein